MSLLSSITSNSPSSLMTLPNATSASAKTKAKANATSTSSSDAGLTSTTAGTTFLNLLVQELQNQDPTAPMDSTSMVGQMISLNQLDQLISINQTLAGNVSSVATGSSMQPASSAQVMAARAALQDQASGSTTAQANALTAVDPNSTLDLSNLNNTLGGK